VGSAENWNITGFFLDGRSTPRSSGSSMMPS